MTKKEIEHIAPNLSTISCENLGFTTPKNYFDSIEDNIEVRIIEDGFDKHQDEFKIPDHYFDSIEATIISKIKSTDNSSITDDSIPENYFSTIEDRVIRKLHKKNKVVHLRTKIIKIASPILVAASLLLLVLLNNTSNNITFDTIAITEIENWMEEEYSTMDSYTIAGIFPDIELEESDFDITFSDEEMIDYLIEEDIESLILEDLNY